MGPEDQGPAPDVDPGLAPPQQEGQGRVLPPVTTTISRRVPAFSCSHGVWTHVAAVCLPLLLSPSSSPWQADVNTRRKAKKTAKVYRAIQGFSVEEMQKRRALQPSQRADLRAAQLREIKQRKKKAAEEKKKLPKSARQQKVFVKRPKTRSVPAPAGNLHVSACLINTPLATGALQARSDVVKRTAPVRPTHKEYP